jgi:hypothetical protein
MRRGVDQNGQDANLVAVSEVFVRGGGGADFAPQTGFRFLQRPGEDGKIRDNPFGQDQLRGTDK